ncbi:MAG: tetratricopeptide repeat protein [Euryarchaeota archaeon]|nr:tetratricopeptide repeat protein [Euryarchaeota archaeon]
MEHPGPEIVGRESELATLSGRLDQALSGRGSTLIVTGEAGLGKTRLMEELRRSAGESGFRVLTGAAAAEAPNPFHLFQRALEGITDRPIFQEREHKTFSTVFAVDKSGALVARASPKGSGGLDAGAFTGTLSAVQNFAKDAFEAGEGKGAGLGRLEYGDLKIIIEHGRGIFIAAVFEGAEHPDMRTAVKGALKDAEGGDAQAAVARLGGTGFLVRRELEGVKLESERIKIADSIAVSLAKVSRERPLLLVMEDLHWADESSLFVLGYLSRSVRSERILLVGTARPGEGAAFEKSFTAMRGEGAASELPLARLGAGSVESLVDQAFHPHAIPKAFIDRLAGQCEGNPFFVTELLRQIRDDGGISLKGGRNVLVREDYAIPSKVDDIVQRRLEALDADAMTLAEYASCIGREFERGAALSMPSLGEPEAALEKLRSSGIIVARNGGAEFTHALFQDAVYRSISPKWKASHHRSIGEHYERAHRGRLGDVAYELARHFSGAGEPAKAFEYSVLAGEKAEGAFAAEQAIRFYEQALSLLPKVFTDAEARARELRISGQLGDVALLSGNYDRARDAFARVIALSDDDETKAKMHRKRTIAYEKQGDFDGAQVEVARGISLVGDASLERWRLEAQLAFVMLRKTNYEEVVSHGERAVEMLSKMKGGESGLGVAYNALGSCSQHRCQFDRALEYYRNGIEVRKATGDEAGLAALYNNVGNLHSDKGEWGPALEYFQKSIATFERIGDPLSVAMVSNNTGSFFFARGDLKTSLEYYQKAMSLLERIGNQWGLSMIYGNIVHIYSKTGEFDKCREYNEKALAIRLRLGDAHGQVMSYVSMGEMEKKLNEHQEAERLFIKAIELSKSVGIGDYLPTAYCNLADTYIDLGRLDEAEGMCREGEILAKEAGMKAEQINVVSIRARAHAARGDYDQAEVGFGEAERLFGEMQLDLDAAQNHYEWAVMLARKGERERARGMLQKVLEMSEKNGWKFYADKSRKALMEIS